MAEAIASGELPRWVARHLDRCPRCRRGLAHVVSRASPLDEAGQALAHQVVFVARVRQLAREVAALEADAPGEPNLTRRAAVREDPGNPEPGPATMTLTALLALAVAVACTLLSLHLVLRPVRAAGRVDRAPIEHAAPAERARPRADPSPGGP